ncbi:flavin reductase [Wangella sp. NEAU-J3]|nr:flavin reductase [Jidongwangia harbinensis]
MEHLPDRPAWDCRVCRMPWPCADARRDLLAEFLDLPSSLIIHLSGRMAEAAEDDVAQDCLHDRFLSWARPPFSDSA